MVNAFHDALLQRLGTIDSIGTDATEALRQRLVARQAQQDAISQQAAQYQAPNYGMDAGYGNSGTRGQNTFENFRSAISGQESGGRYNAVGIPVRGDRAYGKYQIMGNNIPSWTRAALGSALSPSAFLRNAAAQEKTASHFLQSYYNKYGPAGAAVAWYAGEGNAKKYIRNNGKGFGGKQTGGPAISQYAYSILKRMGLA